jgi:hypothetical protein
MEITKEYIEGVIGQEIIDFKVGVNNNGIVEIKVQPKSKVREIEVMININKSDENVS